VFVNVILLPEGAPVVHPTEDHAGGVVPLLVLYRAIDPAPPATGMVISSRYSVVEFVQFGLLPPADSLSVK